MAAKKRKAAETMTEAVRQAILDSGKTFYRLGKESGVSQTVIARFAQGRRDVVSETFGKIAAALNLKLVKGE